MRTTKREFEKTTVEFDLFDWDEDKQQQNLNKHQIDFDDAIAIFENPVVRARSDRNGEVRYLAVGLVSGIAISVVYTERNDRCRVISARRARNYEREAYHTLSGEP